MLHRDRYNTGKAAVGPSSYGQPWVAAMITGNGVNGSPPSLGANGVGWFGKWVNKSVYAFDWRTYAILGTYTPPAPQFCLSTPAIYSDDRVISLDNGGTSKIFAINPATMFHYWAKPIGPNGGSDYERCSPILGPDGDTVIGDNNGKLYRYDSVTGDTRWVISLQGISRHVGFTRDDQYVIVPNGNFLTKIRYSDGQVEWSKNLGSQAGAPSTTSSGLIVAGSTSGVIYGVNLDGSTAWTYQTFGAVYDSPAIDGDRIYVGSDDQYVYRLRASDGAPLWGFVTTAGVRSSPIIGHDGRVYVANRSAAVYCLNPLNGSAIWSRFIEEDVRGSMSIAPDGTLFLPTTSAKGMVILKQQRPIISGQIILDIPSNSYKYPVSTTVTLHNRGSQTVLSSVEVLVGADGLFSAAVDVPFSLSGLSSQGLFDVTVKPNGHLRGRFAVSISDGEEAGLLLNLPLNGDINNDNDISSDDYLVLSEAFDTAQEDPGFSAPADLNGDGYVGTDDYLILNANFDRAGQ